MINSITIYDVLCSFREGTNIKKNVKLKRSVTSLLASPNMYKEIEELYHNLKNALPPQRKLVLPYNSKWWRNKRINELVSRIGKIYNIDKNKKPSYRIEHGYLYNGRILYPYAFEILGIPLANPIEDTTKFIGAINYSISPKNIKFEGEYDVEGQYIEGNIDDVLRSCGFHKHSAKKSRLPCIVIGNLITRIRWNRLRSIFLQFSYATICYHVFSSNLNLISILESDSIDYSMLLCFGKKFFCFTIHYMCTNRVTGIFTIMT
jgi:hypothetical protein